MGGWRIWSKRIRERCSDRNILFLKVHYGYIAILHTVLSLPFSPLAFWNQDKNKYIKIIWFYKRIRLKQKTLKLHFLWIDNTGYTSFESGTQPQWGHFFEGSNLSDSHSDKFSLTQEHVNNNTIKVLEGTKSMSSCWEFICLSD